MSLLSRLAVQASRAYGLLASADKTKVSADYLVIAGGGGGGSVLSFGTDGGGGGGAGGYRCSVSGESSGGGASAESSITLSTLNTYSVIVGAGGVGGTSDASGTNGSNSAISGTGLTTITSTGGGGGGGATTNNGSSGGSGGGATNSGTGGTGTANQGYAGGGGQNACGGGGAGSVGSAVSGSNGGNGGTGVSSSITGTSISRAGGGGGGSDASAGTAGQGSGGGGNGFQQPTTSAQSGTANTGGGGGGSGAPDAYANGGAGGSGVVIISYTATEPKFVGGTITTSGGKQIHTFTSSGTLSPITPITASYLVVAGGGGGAQGGGGAGGLLTSSTTLYSGATYVVTVGAGGTGGPPTTTGSQTNGSDSILSGTGLTTLTAVGGGFGGRTGGGNGNTGGSGGGGAYATNGGAGTSGQGFAGGNGGGASSAGGGGGSSAVGSAGSGSTGGNGGAGTASSITGTSVTYAGGGGGAANTTAGSGGSGGGGSGGVSTTNGGAGTPNLGGGGGGGGATSSTGGNGGSGIVIISYAGSQQFNGGLVTTSGGNTIHTFTSTGALTPLTNNLTNSLRFRASASARLSRTPTVAGNRRTWTWSAWIKRGSISTPTAPNSAYRVFMAGTSGSAEAGIQFYGSADASTLDAYFYSGSYQWQVTTTQVFRDPSAWYHITLAVDTTQATSSNRVKLYINGNQVTAFATANYPTQNSDTPFNAAATPHTLGALTSDSYNYFDGYMDDIYFIDGQALEPYFFGNNDANGVWKPIQYRGTYGTNGFYLNFSNTTSTTTLGFDSSPNGNNWTTNNISLTAGVTYDAMTDVPTNTSATVANYCVLNPLQRGSSITLSNANLTWSTSGSSSKVLSTIGMSSGKYYCEFTMASGNGNYGVATGRTGLSGSNYLGDDTNSWCYAIDGNKYTNGSGAAYGATYTAGDIIGVAFDADAGTLSYFKNGTSQGTAFTGLTNGPYFFAQGADPSAGSVNFGQRPFTYTPPTGFVALNTFNLPTPTILQGNRFMDATLWTGNGPASQVIVNQGQFKPDMVWVKNRSSTRKHNIYDSVRGVAVGASYRLVPNLTSAEDNPAYGVTSMNSNGFTIGEEGDVNANGLTFVGWQWQAGQGSTSSNTAGSITSTVSVSTTAGFSIVTYTGNGVNGATVGHGLGVAPSMIIIKNRSATADWVVGTNPTVGAFPYTRELYLNKTDSYAFGNSFNNLAPTSSVFSIGSSATSNTNTNTYVAYCWAEIAGFSRFGSYTGGGNTGASTPNANGPFIYLGFRPKFVLIKRTSSAADWVIYDSVRGPSNANYPWLYPNSSSAEVATETVDFLSNGFKIRSESGATMFPDGATFIYAAFAEHPFKNSNAR